MRGYIIWGISILVVLFFFDLNEKFVREWLLYWGGIAFFLTLIARALAYSVYRCVIQKQKYKVLLIGNYTYCDQVAQALRQDQYSEFEVSRVLVRESDSDAAALLGWNTYSMASLQELNIDEDEVWICLPISLGDQVAPIVDALDKMSLNIRFMPGMQELRLINYKPSTFSGVRLLDISCSPMTKSKRCIKRLEDIVLSSLIIVMIFPVLLLVALGVKLSSQGPIFYRQTRVSWNNRNFGMLKFRSMPVDSEKSKVVWGNAKNKDITPFGKFIRKASLDELPQFLNVLKGDMSIVGPRPERDIFVKKFGEEIPGYMQKHMVKAGITGWAQIHGLRGDTSLERRVEYDLWYIENWSLWLDIKIIFMTFFKVISDKSAS
ncbi:sugar transferase family protein [Zymobacter palmae]|uniref:Sugar transferase family protein n=2 Tax=Zymobacter palmae TaxID=33074 RepID=A0A348HGL7_9GAMM|nr:sugar transferase family protein [Zymobacter palmae]